jgi:acetoin:2,6-dichlorophenolindophenol oxidoreductase subunit alpha
MREQLLRRVHADAQGDGGRRHTARAAAYGIPAHTVDGNDLWAVREAALQAVDQARGRGGPTLLECQTYRHHGHSKADPAKYRPPEKVERWLARDPLEVAKKRLRDLGVREEELSTVEDTTKARIEQAVQAAPYPDPATQQPAEFAP